MAERLRVDVNLATEDQIGKAGLRRADFDSIADRAEAAHEGIVKGRQEGKLQFMDLPRDAQAAKAARELGWDLARNYENLVVLGIGGSSLGAKALCSGLWHPFHNLLAAPPRMGARIFFPDNSDPATFAALLHELNLNRTAVAAITKSGGTAETWAQLLVIRDRMREAYGDPKKQIIAITDPQKGALRAVAAEEGWRTLPVPPAVGGRFSVLSAVGLLPAAAAGIDIDAVLAGAQQMVDRCQAPGMFENPAYLFAATLYLLDTRRGRRIHVFMPYADALRDTSEWFVQLWAESLGKKAGTADGSGAVGPTPLGATGATDQHSLLQLLMEGPQDKAVAFVAADRPRVDLTIPQDFPGQPDVAYLGGHTMHELLTVEQRATASALAANGRPSLTIHLPSLDPRALGELMMMLEIATSFAGGLYGVDPYDQPGVEAGKRYACGLLGRPGYEGAKKDLAQRPQPRPEWVL